MVQYINPADLGMSHARGKHVCPLCQAPITQTPAELLRQNKKFINHKLAALTNPPMPTNTFYALAMEILDEYNLGQYMVGISYDPTDTEPQCVRLALPSEWDSVLVLQWCYGKMEVAYLS